MKLNRLSFEKLFLAALLSVAVAGCQNKPYGVTKLPNGGAGATTGNPSELSPGNQVPGSGETTGGAGPSSTGIPASTVSHDGWPEDREALKAQTVHFDYDSTVIKSKDKPNVAAVAEYLKSNSSAAVRIEGHCDERGTDEYNRALGERRAGAIREQLVGMGIDPNRIDTISFGRDKPADTGHSEAAHARNRRGEFVVLTAPK